MTDTKGVYCSTREHEYGKPIINPPTIGGKQVTINEYIDFISRERKLRD